MDFFLRVRRPAIDFCLRLSGCALATAGSAVMYPLLAYGMTGEWITVSSLMQKAISAHEWGAFLALCLPGIIATLSIAAIVEGLVFFVRDVKRALLPDNGGM